MLTELFASTTDDAPRRSIVLLCFRVLVGTRLGVELFLFLFLGATFLCYFQSQEIQNPDISLFYCLHDGESAISKSCEPNRPESCVDDKDVGVRILSVRMLPLLYSRG
jgi:hypothetical protein